MRDIVDDSWSLLHAANADSPRFFRFGDVLADIDVATNPIRPRTFAVPILRLHLDRLGDYTATRADGDEHSARPPKDVLESMLSVVPPTIPRLVGVVGAPFLAPDGTVIASEGYHTPTGLYLALGDLSVPPVSRQPSASEVAHAKELLLTELLGDFPFSEEADKTHALSAILTPVVRPLIDGPTPLFVIEAPTEGTGKGLLAEIISYLATGSPAPVMAEGGDDDEWRKRITAALLGAPPVVLIDNLKRRLESGALSAAITATVWTDRFLGHSRQVSIPVRTTWLATGNNPTYSKEMARRVVRSRIDAALELPQALDVLVLALRVVKEVIGLGEAQVAGLHDLAPVLVVLLPHLLRPGLVFRRRLLREGEGIKAVSGGVANVRAHGGGVAPHPRLVEVGLEEGEVVVVVKGEDDQCIPKDHPRGLKY